VRAAGGPLRDKKGTVRSLMNMSWGAPSAAVVLIEFADGREGYQVAADPETIEGEESGRVMRATCELTRRLNSARADKDEKARPG